MTGTVGALCPFTEVWWRGAWIPGEEEQLRCFVPSWRKNSGALTSDGDASKKGEDDEVTSPLKIQHHNSVETTSKSVLFAGVGVEGKGEETGNGGGLEEKAEKTVVENAEGHVNRAQQDMHVDGEPLIPEVEKPEGNVNAGAKHRPGMYKKIARSSEPKGNVDLSMLTERKRHLINSDDVETEEKKLRLTSQNADAGL